MLWNVLIVKLEKIVHYEFICISFSFVHAPVCANCNYSCKLYIFQKKKNDPYFGMGKNTKVMPQYPAIYLLSWEREGILTYQKPYIKTKYKCTFCPALSMKKKFRFRQNVDNTHQNYPKYVHFFTHEFCTFPVTEGNEI